MKRNKDEEKEEEDKNSTRREFVIDVLNMMNTERKSEKSEKTPTIDQKYSALTKSIKWREKKRNTTSFKSKLVDVVRSLPLLFTMPISAYSV